jgi:hypothetical protein
METLRHGFEMDPMTRSKLEGLLRAQKTPLGLAKRAKAMLLLADGLGVVKAARAANLHRANVCRWRERFMAEGPAGLLDLPRPGRPPRETVVESRFLQAIPPSPERPPSVAASAPEMDHAAIP